MTVDDVAAAIGEPPPSASLTPDAFDDLVDTATHAVNNLIPDGVLATMTNAERSRLLVEIDEALTDILNEYIEKDL